MAISIDYSNPAQFVIQIPRADMLLLATTPSEIRQINVNDLRIELHDLQDGANGMWAPTAFSNVPPLTVGGVTLARSLEIVSPYVIEFEDGLYNVNVVGGNSNVSDVTVKNQVGVNTANSAGLQDPFALQASAFGDVVSFNPAGLSGTTFPRGTPSFPSNNVADTIAIAVARGLRTISVQDDTTFTTGDFSRGYTFRGTNPTVVITLDPGVDVVDCVFDDLTIQGTLDGRNTLRHCTVLDVNYVNGTLFQCGLGGTVTLGGATPAIFYQCYSLVAGGGAAQYPLIDCGGALLTPLIVRDWQGGLGLRNMTSQDVGAPISLDFSSGRLVVEPTVSAGAVTMRGLASSEDNSTGTFVLNDQTITADAIRVRKHLTNRFETDPSTGVATLYEDDGATVAETSTLYEDVNGVQTYRGQGAERRNGFTK